MSPEPVSEQEWQARQDAQVLVEAESIKKDPRRMQAAKSSIDQQKKQLEKASEEINGSSRRGVQMKNGVPQFD